MDKRLMDLAIAFASCKSWIYLPGMAQRRVERSSDINWRRLQQPEDAEWATGLTHTTWVPDLDDELTCSGINVVLRKAYKDPRISCSVIKIDEDGNPLEWQCVGARLYAFQPTELEAQLAALKRV